MESILRVESCASLTLGQMRDIMHGRAVIEQEIKGLRSLTDSLDQSFADAVELISASRGRVIISGMGKSGLIGRKIAATLSSTGTPAHYVHPAEASHGDLGMITPNDVALVLSNSGETTELSDLIAYCKRFSIPLIAVVKKRDSTLGNAADLVIQIPAVEEASPTNAPTTSTTMMVALGDALAIALVERKGFTREDFSIFHPGGKLGKALIRVSDLMHRSAQLPVISSVAEMREVLLMMTSKSFGCAGILGSEGQLVGIITDGDLRRHMVPDLLDKIAADVMTINPLTIRSTALAVEALALMNQRCITSLFVIDYEKPVGILHIHDCLRAGIV